MKRIAVIGAGQAGLLLTLGLLERGYSVTLVTDRPPEAILHGPVPAGAVVFNRGLAVERELKVNFWDGTALACEATHVDLIGPDGRIALSFESALDQPGLCVDQRLKSFRWIEEVARRGGRIVVKPATLSDLESYAREHDLVVVAAGKGEISGLFPRDAARSPFDGAARVVSMVVVSGSQRWDNFRRPGPKFILLPGIGEIFSAPMYSKDGEQGIFLGYEAIPGGPMDRFAQGMSPQAQLEFSKEIFHDLVPWDYEAIRHTRLVDDRAHLYGKIVPTVRRPVGVLPSGALVVGIGDTVNLHDPIAAQGANNAAKAAWTFIQRIVERADGSFDRSWMEDVFEEIWADAQYGNRLGQMLLAPPEPHAVDILIAAAQHPVVAHRFINGFAHPPDMFPWFADATEARRFLQSVAGCSGATSPSTSERA